MSHISSSITERVTIPLLGRWKGEGRRLAMTTAYDAVSARIADPVVDILLVGDSVGAAVDQLEYLDLVDWVDLKPVESPLRSTAALCVAAYVGSTRLIDNIILPLPT